MTEIIDYNVKKKIIYVFSAYWHIFIELQGSDKSIFLSFLLFFSVLGRILLWVQLLAVETE